MDKQDTRQFWVMAALALGMIILQGFATWALIYKSIPASNQNAFMFLLGILSTNVGTIIAFYFVGSVSSRKKDDTISQLATAQVAHDTVQQNQAKPIIQEQGNGQD